MLLAAMAMALRLVWGEEPAVFYTDCLILLDIINHWQRMDFGPYVGAEQNRDILEDILHAIIDWQAAAARRDHCDCMDPSTQQRPRE
eukprot:2865389-Rhodomonas_salina.2